MKKKTLNQTWVLCLRMWRSISKEWIKNKRRSVNKLKKTWLKKNGFKWERLISNCFFCDYNDEDDDCNLCPGKLIEPFFSCTTREHHYEGNPSAFYKKLLQLNRIRKNRKK